MWIYCKLHDISCHTPLNSQGFSKCVVLILMHQTKGKTHSAVTQEMMGIFLLGVRKVISDDRLLPSMGSCKS